VFPIGIRALELRLRHLRSSPRYKSEMRPCSLEEMRVIFLIGVLCLFINPNLREDSPPPHFLVTPLSSFQSPSRNLLPVDNRIPVFPDLFAPDSSPGCFLTKQIHSPRGNPKRQPFYWNPLPPDFVTLIFFVKAVKKVLFISYFSPSCFPPLAVNTRYTNSTPM